jgi:hypothetical protein
MVCPTSLRDGHAAVGGFAADNSSCEGHAIVAGGTGEGLRYARERALNRAGFGAAVERILRADGRIQASIHALSCSNATELNLDCPCIVRSTCFDAVHGIRVGGARAVAAAGDGDGEGKAEQEEALLRMH